MLYGIKIHSLQKIAIPVQTKQLHRDSARQHAVGIGPQNGLLGHWSAQEHHRRSAIPFYQHADTFVLFDSLKKLAE